MTSGTEVTICDVLTDLLIEQKRTNEFLAELVRHDTGERQSSVEIKFLANGTPQPTVKIYAGSPAPVDEAIDAYARTVVAAERGQLDGWEQTLRAKLAEKHQAIFGSEETGTAYDLPVSHRA